METTEIIEQPAVQETQAPSAPKMPEGIEGEFPTTFYSKPESSTSSTSSTEQSTLQEQVQEARPETHQEIAPVVPESVSPAETAVPALDHEKWLQEQTNGRFKSKDELANILQDPLSLLPEDERQLIAIKRSGIEPMEYLRIQSADFKAMNAEEMLRYDFLNAPENKNLPADLQEIAFENFKNSQFPNLDSVIEDDPRARLDRFNLEQKAEAARNKWVGEQEKMRIVPTSQEQTGGLSKEEQEAQAAKHLANVEKVLGNSVKTYEVKSGDETVSITLKNEAIKEQLKNGLVDPVNNFLLPKWANPDGTLNVAQMEEDQMKLLMWDEALKSAYERGVSKRETQVMKVLENPEPVASVAASNTEVDPSIVAARIAAKQKNPTGGRFASY